MGFDVQLAQRVRDVLALRRWVERAVEYVRALPPKT
jgi:hypothetical protein